MTPREAAAAVSEPDPRDARIAELEAALANSATALRSANGVREEVEAALRGMTAALSGGTPTLDRLVREATDAGRRKGRADGAAICASVESGAILDARFLPAERLHRAAGANECAHAIRALMGASDGE